MILSTWTRSWKEFGESSAKHPNSWSIACTVLDKAVRFNLWTSFVQLNNSREKAILNTKEMLKGDVTSTWADTTGLKIDYNYCPKISIEEEVNHFVILYRNFYKV